MSGGLIMGTGLLVCGVRKQAIVVWMLLFGWVLFLVPAARAQMSDEEKRQLFLQSREDIHPVPKPSPSATPRRKPKPASTSAETPASHSVRIASIAGLSGHPHSPEAPAPRRYA